MMHEHHGLRLSKEYFKFSCGHFLIFPDGSKERLHGHNYQVRVRIDAALSNNGLVVDFIQVKPVIRKICDELDEHLILPGQHAALVIDPERDGHRQFHYGACHYQAPASEVIVLPINNSSVENLSRWFAHELHARLLKRFPDLCVHAIEVEISETSGQSAFCTLTGEPCV